MLAREMSAWPDIRVVKDFTCVTVPEEIHALCASIERFMDEFVYPLERSERWRMEAGGPAYPPLML